MSALVDKVAQKLGISREVAADRVDEFVDQIQSVTGEASAAQVEGLGTFTFDEGEVRFTPDPRLAVVVNHRFAGLAPIPVESVADAGRIDESSFALPDIPIAVQHDMDSRSEREHAPPMADSTSDVVEDTVDELRDDDVDPGAVAAVGPGDLGSLTPSKPTPGDEPPKDTVVESEHRDSVVGEATETEPAKVAGTGADASRDTVATDADIAAPENAETVAAVPTDEPDTLDSSNEDDKPEGTAAESGQAPPAVVKRKSRALFYFGMIVVLVLAIAGVLYLISLGDGPPSDRQDEVVETEAGTSPGGSEAAATTPSGLQPPLIAWEPGAIDRRAGGYTLIVSSQETIDEANAVALELSQQLADEDLPIDVLRGTARGQTWYRVAIGQYSRQSIATRELRRLAEKLPEGAWVLRIRNNM